MVAWSASVRLAWAQTAELSSPEGAVGATMMRPSCRGQWVQLAVATLVAMAAVEAVEDVPLLALSSAAACEEHRCLVAQR